ncbi:TraR/DksA family transcriptional regulator [bacterium]|nr:TraR/DksA family transcriptional regulator [bacterium]MBU1153446.1 TraR/DksA family transcriptional regulator [bacterium]MBU1782792.1 TraR/DksA family transcriptional regulator [bacterium]MBU2599700.1 TraR/DksA family transcriptional regulator [bacterium]
MEERQREIFKEKLLKLRAEYVKEVQSMEKENLRNSLRNVSGNLSGYSQHIAEIAADSSEQEKNIQLLSSVSHLLAEVNEVLHKMEDGSYGICEDCSQEIPLNRLEAIPYAKFCLKCKEKNSPKDRRR